MIGGGGAGCRAAREAAKLGASVAIVFKKAKRSSGCTAKAVSELSAYSAAFGYRDPRDKPLNHYLDTVHEGAGLADETLVRILAKEAPCGLEEIAELGATFNMKDGRFDQLLADASTLPRAVNCGADTGREILNTLIDDLEKTEQVTFYENVVVLRLLTNNNTVVGALAIDIKAGEYILFAAKSTVLATGGACYLYELNGQPDDLTGTGYGMAYEIGASFVNMEMIQFGPAIIYPVKGYLLVTSYWKLNPRLYNGNGDDFLYRYVPDGLTAAEALRAKEFAFPFNVGHPGMYVDIAMHQEICEGRGSEHGGIYLDISHNAPDVIEQMVPVSFRWFMEHGIDIRKGPIEIAPIAQCYIGGVYIDEKTHTSLDGLFCCGEVEGTVHGAARPGGNMLAASQVFGKIAGGEAAKRALPLRGVIVNESQAQEVIAEINRLQSKKDGFSAHDVLQRIQKLMWRHVSICRHKKGLEQALAELDKIKDEMLPDLGAKDLLDAVFAYEIRHMLQTARMVTLSALLREETRGSHYRTDFPDRDSDNWLKLIRMRGPGEICVGYPQPRRLADFYVGEA